MEFVGVDRDVVAKVIGEHTQIEPAGQAPITVDRVPLVLIAPSYGNRATRQRFADTLADPVNFLDEDLRAVLSETEGQELLSRHLDGAARFWGALPSHDGIIDRLRPGDLIVFTGQNRVQAIGTLACKLRNQALAELLWPPDPDAPGWVNVYSVVDFRRVSGPGYPEVRKWVGSNERDVFQSARVLTPEKSAAVLDGLADLGVLDGALDVLDEPVVGEETGPATVLTVAEFERHLHTAGEIIGGRRQLGPDAKWYLLGVLLLKYASDTSEAGRAWLPREEFTARQGRGQRGRSFADRPSSYPHDLVVPAEARWSYLMARAFDGVGRHLNQALRALERANPAVLGGVLGHIDFTREIGGERLPDGTLGDLLSHFAQLPLASGNTPPDVLGHGFEYLVTMFPEVVSSKTGGDFYTPADVTRLMIQLLDPTAETTIYDPCAGVGGMLIGATEHVAARSRNFAPATVAGQEISSSTWALAKLNLLMHRVDNTGLVRGDTLAEPMHVRAGTLERFDRAISNPPFGGRVATDGLPHPERFKWGLRPGNAHPSELLFVQHAVSVLKAEGVAAVVLPRGVLFRRGAELPIRTALLDDDVIEAVIALPEKLFYSTTIATCVLVLRPPGTKPPRREGRILFVDLPAEKSGRHRRLVSERVEDLLAAYHAFEDIPGFARVVDRADVRDNDDNLTVELYVRKDSSVEAETSPADSWETRLRDLVLDGRYDEAATMLGERVGPDAVHDGEWDPERVAQLGMEFGFLHLPDGDRRVVGAVWAPIAQANRFAPSPSSETEAEDDAPPEQEGDDHGSEPAGTVAAGRTPQQSGAVLEQATVDLFSQLFHIDPDNRELLVTRLRNQRAGTQYGHDVAVECSVAGSPTVRCHLECKNLHRAVTLADIADKLIQEKFYPGGARVDHWILVSPHASPSNELRQMLEVWEEKPEYPFSVQVWSPEEGVEGLFALAPEVYRAVYGRPPGARELAMAESAVASLRKSLAPRLPIDRIWHTYLGNPHRLCFVTEDFRHFDELYGNQVQLRVTDDKGALLKGTLLDETLAWVHGESTGPMLLLADFGEGKSFFTYSLARRLCEEYRWSPTTGVFPLRIPLREFAQARSGRALLQRRLEELGATLDQWRDLARRGRTLAILDGFDEMTADLSPAAITENLRSVDSCLTELTGSKVLVTSRRRLLSVRDWGRVLDKLRQPTVREIASGSRDQRVQYLEQFATDDRSAQVLDNLRNLHDPIGLAAKPLFLQMIKDTLAELPDGAFSELILYTTYVEKGLQRKVELLEDDNLSLTGDQLVENLMAILEDVAIELQGSNKSSVYLRDYCEKVPNGIAAMLWQMSDDAAAPVSSSVRTEDDATARIGVRSLLKAVRDDNLDRWPVDFFHRSMREYFFARALVSKLRTDPQRARDILNATPLPPEITHFVAELLRVQADSAPLSHLESFARSATIALPDAYLGGNSLTLLYATRGELPNCDWSGLRLDHAQLAGADLANARFVRTSLRNANLDNADLTGADFTNADLDGVRLEETARVAALTALDHERIVVAYEDGSLRVWRPRPGGSYVSQVIARAEHPVERLYTTPRGRMAAIGGGVFSLYELHGLSLVLNSRFGTKSRFRLTLPGERTALLLEETNGGRTRVSWSDTTGEGIRGHWDADGVVTCSAQLDGRAYAVALDEQVRVVLLDERGSYDVRTLEIGRTSCLSLGLTRDGNVLLALGQHDGRVRVNQLTGTALDGPGVVLWQNGLHTGTVTTIAFGDRGQLITGGADRTVCIVPSADGGPGPSGHSVRQLHLTLRCRGVKADGVRTEREQQRLRQHASAPLATG